jgi:hypothetical protein
MRVKAVAGASGRVTERVSDGRGTGFRARVANMEARVVKV